MKKAITFLVTAAMAVTAYAYDKPTAVDMGISVKFASGVITTEGSPNYFYFGETVPPQTMNQLHSFSGVKIGSDISGTLYDAATMNLGKEWRMPTKQEMQELIDNTVVESATVNSKKGLKFTAANGNTIFIPSSSSYCAWTSSTDYSTFSYPNEAAMALYVSGSAASLKRNQWIGTNGLMVIPVLNERKDTKVASFGLNETSLSLREGKSARIFPVDILPVDAADKMLEFTSSNPEVATVSAIGEISALSAGEATVTVKAVDGSDVKAECKVTVTAKPVVERKVDLGLSVMWGAYNVGADQPTDLGSFYGYGELETHDVFSQDGYTHYNYNKSSISLPKDPIRGSQWDVAKKEWGENWCIPSKAMIQELIDNCTVTSEKEGDVVLYRFTSKINGNSILVPATGYVMNAYTNMKTKGYFWSSDVVDAGAWTPKAYGLEVANTSAKFTEQPVYYGMPVRPVYFEAPALTGIELTCSEEIAEIYDGQALTVTATPVPALAPLPDDLSWSVDGDACTLTVNSDKTSVSVIGKAEGTAKVKVTASGIDSSVSITVKGYTPTEGDVDMGYGRIWSSMNLGAKSIEELGDNYWYGLIEPQENKFSHTYDWPKEDIAGIADYDPAVAIGEGWSCGSNENWLDLFSNTTCVFLKYNDVYGYAYFSKHNDNSVFFPIVAARLVSYKDGKWSSLPSKYYLVGTRIPNNNAYVYSFNPSSSPSKLSSGKPESLNAVVRASREKGNGETTGIENIEIGDDSRFDVYTVMGLRVLSASDRSALSSLPAGIYILRSESGKTVKVRL